MANLAYKIIQKPEGVKISYDPDGHNEVPLNEEITTKSIYVMVEDQ